MSQGRVHTFASLRDDIDFIEIPIIQRDYAQGRSVAADVRMSFLEALRSALQPGAPALDLDFVYGSVTTDGARHLSVLDGQQRLTTLFLLHWYLAVREGQLADFRQRWVTPDHSRSRFSYATRPSAAEFFQSLVCHDLALPFMEGGSPPSALIAGSKWFFDAWRRDPTVGSCLVMLDAIHQVFCAEAPGKYVTLVQSHQVTFHFLNLRDFGLSDELYIKMNSRGKPLTDFENFKAWLIERASGAPWFDAFAEGMDQQWLDFFWDLSGRSDGQESSTAAPIGYDGLFLRFFYLHAYFEACQTFDDKSGSTDAPQRAWLGQVREVRGYVALRSFEAIGVLHAAELAGTMQVLDFLSSSAHTDIRTLLVSALEPKAGHEEQLHLHALAAFLRAPGVTNLTPEAHARCLHRWLRVASNLIRNSRIEDVTTAAPAVKGLTELAAHATDIFQALANRTPTQRGFSKEQALEEARKAQLVLQDPEWEALLEAAEAHWYLKGRVGFLIDLSAAKASSADKALFRIYADAMHRIVTPALLDSSQFLLQRALLTLYDYLPSAAGGNHTFCIPNATAYRVRQENWLAVFQDPRFGLLLDAVGGQGPDALEQLIHASSATGWRQRVIADPELIAYCQKRLVRWHGTDLLLLTKLRLSGYFAEVHSLALYHALLKRGQTLPSIVQVAYESVYNEGWPGVVVRIDQDYWVRFCDGNWQCTLGDGNPVPLPNEIATAIAAMS